MVLNKVTETAADVIGSVNKMAEQYDPSLENKEVVFGGASKNAQPIEDQAEN
jgi:hypothetical protein